MNSDTTMAGQSSEIGRAVDALPPSAKTWKITPGGCQRRRCATTAITVAQTAAAGSTSQLCSGSAEMITPMAIAAISDRPASSCTRSRTGKGSCRPYSEVNAAKAAYSAHSIRSPAHRASSGNSTDRAARPATVHSPRDGCTWTKLRRNVVVAPPHCLPPGPRSPAKAPDLPEP